MLNFKLPKKEQPKNKKNYKKNQNQKNKKNKNIYREKKMQEKLDIISRKRVIIVKVRLIQKI